jgi:hypothetical protein
LKTQHANLSTSPSNVLRENKRKKNHWPNFLVALQNINEI